MKKIILTALFLVFLVTGCGKQDSEINSAAATGAASGETQATPTTEDDIPSAPDWAQTENADDTDSSDTTTETEEPGWKKPNFTEAELASWDEEDIEDPEDELWDVYEAERIKTELEEKHGYEIRNLLDAHFISFEQYPGLYNILRGSFIDLKPSYIEIVPESIEGDYSQGKCRLIPEGYNGERGEIWLYGKDGGLNISWVHTTN